MKKLKLVLLSLLVGLMANATDGELAQFDKIEIVLVDGTKYEIPINNQSYIYSYVEGTGLAAQQLVRVKGDNCEYLFNRNEISKMRCMEIIAGIESGVYRAMVAANGNGGGSQTIRIINEIDGDVVGEKVIRYHNGIVMQTGESPLLA